METTAPIQTKFCTVTETTNIHVQFVGGPNRRITIQDGDGHLQNALTSWQICTKFGMVTYIGPPKGMVS